MDTNFNKLPFDFAWWEIEPRILNKKSFEQKVKEVEIEHGKENMLFKESSLFHVNYSLEGREIESVVNVLIRDLYSDTKLRKDSTVNIRNAIKGILANAFLSYKVFEGSGFVRIKRGNTDYKTNKYNPNITKRNLIDVLDRLEKNGWIEYYPAIYFEKRYKGKVKFDRFTSRYRFKWDIYALLIVNQVGYKNLTYVSDTVILKGKDNPTSPQETIQLYRETDTTKQMRKDLAKYNALLTKNHDMIVGGVWDKKGRAIDFTNYTNRFYYRIFTRNNFKCHGRFYGHWIVQYPSEARKYVMFGGEPTRQLDYSNCLMHVAYSLINTYHHSEEDLYDMVDEDRAWVKQFCTIAPNTNRLHSACRETVRALGLNWNRQTENKAYQVATKVMETHENIYHAFFYKGKDTGQILTWHESAIANQVIMHFVNKGILILVIHDGFMVEKKHSKELKDVMKKKWLHHFKRINKMPSLPRIKEDKHINEIENTLKDVSTFKRN